MICTCRGCGTPFDAPPVHRVLCGDSRKQEDVDRLFAGAKANVAITSPPYAHDGERSLYVKDLVLAHKRAWAWRFVDEFCWRNTKNGVPGGWPNRFKNAWEPVFHFARSTIIKFHADAVSTKSTDVFQYSPDNAKSGSDSGLLGSGKRKNQGAGIARPSNVIEVGAESGQGDHSAPFPRALVEFFVKAFSDPLDIVFDPFTGSGTSLAAAHVLGRLGYGIEISPGYCDVIVRRLLALCAGPARLEATGQTFDEVATSRGLPQVTAAPDRSTFSDTSHLRKGRKPK